MIFPLAHFFSLEKPENKSASRHPCEACEKEHGRRRARSTRVPAGCRAPRVIRTANFVVVPEKAHRPLDSSRSSGFPGARPRVDPPRLRGPQESQPPASASQHAPHRRHVDESRRAGGAERRRPETQKRAERARGASPSPSRRHPRPRARAARRPPRDSTAPSLRAAVSAVLPIASFFFCR